MDLFCLVHPVDRAADGACWSPVDGRLYWFDVAGQRISSFDPATNASNTYELPVRASAAAPRAAGGLLLLTDQGLAICEPDGGVLNIISPISLEAGLRTGDGKVDLEGNFWWAVVDDGADAPRGAIYRTTGALETTQVLRGVHEPNGLSVSADGRRLYVAESRLQAIFSHDLADPSQSQLFADLRGQPGKPDGLAVDVDGYVWCAQPGGGRISRYAPDGKIAQTIPMPVLRPTSLAFGGPDLATLFVLGAKGDVTQAQPLADGVFSFEPTAKGLRLPLFIG